MNWFPIFLDLRSASCLVVGGGAVAGRKAKQLLAAGARVTVTAPELHLDLSRLAERGAIVHIARTFEPGMMDDCELAIAATDSSEVNRQVSIEARRRRLPVNVVDEPALCKFIMPAIVDRSPVVIAVSTGGCAPVLARKLKTRIEALLPRDLGTLATVAGSLRQRVKTRVPDSNARRRLWEYFFDETIAGHVDSRHAAQVRPMIETLIDSGIESKPQGDVCLIGPAPEDPELLTLKALRLMQQCDVILHDEIVSPGVLAL
ncbi:MAG TPA: NAD(P)-dependent oxidoreductase, partial [Burkholderiales bacterium]|nr:NAD(P)-dependent oxidoreductase [Burkholderiales bacterium]